MPVGDAVQKVPTFDEQVAAFKGFTTENGEVAAGEQTTEEKEASEAREAANEAAKLATQGGAEEVPAKADEKEPEVSAKADAPKPKKTAEARISELTATLRDRERALTRNGKRLESERYLREQVEQRIAALERGETKPLTAERQAATDGAPDPKKYQYGELDAEYIRALARHETQQELASAAKKTKDEQQRDAAAREQREVAKQASALVAAGSAKYDDFEEVVMEGARNGEWLLSDALGKLLLTSEHGAEIAYTLATHPDVAEEIAGKPPLEQAAWLGRQEAKLSSASPGAAAKPAAKVTKAPIPPKDVAKGAGGNSGAPAEDTNDFRAFERGWRQSIGA